MKTKSLDIYFVQEMWSEGDVFDEVINGYHVFRHNGGKGNHNFRRVANILSPHYLTTTNHFTLTINSNYNSVVL